MVIYIDKTIWSVYCINAKLINDHNIQMDKSKGQVRKKLTI